MRTAFYSGIFSIVLFLLPLVMTAQRSSLVSRDTLLPNNINFAVSYGEILKKRDAWFYGFTAEYSRRFKKAPVGLGLSLMWDSETDKAKTNPVQTVTAAIAGSYLIGDRFSLGTGIAKGFIDDENPQRAYKFTDGDWTTGLIFAYIIPTGQATFIGFTTSLEYNISQKEFSLSIDLSYAFNW